MNYLPIGGEKVIMSKAGAILTLGPRLQEGGQGVVHAATTGESMFAVKWLRSSEQIQGIRMNISRLTDRPNPHPAFLWPIDLVSSEELQGFGYVMRYMEPRFISFARMLNDGPSFRDVARVGRNLVDAFVALHTTGLCYRDISFGNLFVDPNLCEPAICDNDNIGVDGTSAFIKGTNQFMAPEIVRNEAVPSTITDLFSLAVFLFILFMRGHPLEGVRTLSRYSWSNSAHVSDGDLLQEHFGIEPLFVFDPVDSSNRPPEGDAMLTYWPIYPTFFRRLFLKSFTTGLSDASLTGRITGGVWRRSLVRLSDCISECQCRASVFYDSEDPRRICWNCHEVPRHPPILEVTGSSVVLSDRAVVTAHHLRRNKQHDVIVGLVETLPGDDRRWTMRNTGDVPWTIMPQDEDTKVVGPGQRMGVRPMAIDFGVAQGTIHLAPDLSGRSTIGSDRPG